MKQIKPSSLKGDIWDLASKLDIYPYELALAINKPYSKLNHYLVKEAEIIADKWGITISNVARVAVKLSKDKPRYLHSGYRFHKHNPKNHILIGYDKDYQ